MDRGPAIPNQERAKRNVRIAAKFVIPMAKEERTTAGSGLIAIPGRFVLRAGRFWGRLLSGVDNLTFGLRVVPDDLSYGGERNTARARVFDTDHRRGNRCSVPEIEQKMEQLAGQLEVVKGKKSYGYLPKSVKKTVDEVVDKLEELPVVQACYDQWYALQNEVDSYYHDKPREKKKLSQEKEFRQIKNAVIQEAERIRLGDITFEDADLTSHDEPEQLRGESYACWELRQIIQDESLPPEDRDGAAEELERLAERGDAHAQYMMGLLYRDGPLLIPDIQKAKHWLTQAAGHGLPEAQYALGKLFLSDDPEARDPDEGIRWLKQAAESGDHFAAYRLGKEYLSGEVVSKDATRATAWLTQSAEAGNQYAQYMLGKLYLTGQGVTHDQTQAMVWFSRSAAQGNQYAQFFLERQNDLRPPSVMLAATRLLYHMSRIFENHALPHSNTGLHVDRKLRRKIQEKKIAMGHKPDDHEETPQQDMGGMTMGW